MGTGHYILDKHGEPKLLFSKIEIDPISRELNKETEKNMAKWSNGFFANPKRVVAKTAVGKVEVSTVFLGLDHNWGSGPPILWETMIFGGKLDQHQERCSGTREQAEAMHAKVVAMVTLKKKKPVTRKAQ